MTGLKKATLLAAVAALAVSMLALPASAEEASTDTRTYKVTVTNLTGGQLMTPYVVAAHTTNFRLFRRGSDASHGLQQLAENGGVPVLLGELGGNSQVRATAVAGAAPIAPGASVEVYIDADREATRLSLAGMLICTNDGFGGLSNVRLQDGKKTYYGSAYDAGTELNTETYADLVPPCDGMGQTGTTNPALAENSSVRRHHGIAGDGDLDSAIHGWKGAVIKVTVERVD